MRFCFQYPDAHGTEIHLFDSGPLTEVAQAAEQAGFAAFALTEHPAPSARWLNTGGHQSIDPLVGLAAVGAVTSRMRLLTYVLVGPYRNPLLTAKAAATVDLVSNGRMTLGLGTGYQKSEYFALGVAFDERNALFDELLDVLPLHWSGESFNYQGRHFDARAVQARPAPVQRPIPVWIGGNSTLTRRRVVERGQGWMPVILPPEMTSTRTPPLTSVAEVGTAISQMNDAAAEAGRTEPIEVICGGVPLDHTGSVERNREAIGVAEAAGIGYTLVRYPPGSRDATLDFLQMFGETYIS